jgi:hypothetical protein
MLGRTMAQGLMFAAAIAGIAAAAYGQATGSIRKDSAPIDVPDGRVTGDAARAVSDNLAFCIVKRHYLSVRKALAPPRNLMNDYKFLPKLMDNDCFSGSGTVRSGGGVAWMDLTTNPISFRGGLYKALVRKDFGRRPATFGAAALVIEGDDGQILQFADCVVRADPESSRRLLLTVAGTSGEQMAIDAVKPGLAKCAVPDMRMRFSKGALIGDLAEAYYREADAATSAGAK